MKKPLRYLLSISAASIVVALTITGLFIAYRPPHMRMDHVSSMGHFCVTPPTLKPNNKAFLRKRV